MADPLTPYAIAVAERSRSEQALAEEQKRHLQAVQEIQARLRLLNGQIDGADAGLCDVGSIADAQRLLVVEWASEMRARPPAEVHMQFAAAVRDLQEGCPRMKNRYFGIKAYDRWGAQIADCEYGMGPRHGSIWFRIGLSQPRSVLSEEERRACIRYLKAVQADPNQMLD